MNDKTNENNLNVYYMMILVMGISAIPDSIFYLITLFAVVILKEQKCIGFPVKCERHRKYDWKLKVFVLFLIANTDWRAINTPTLPVFFL